VSVPVSWSSRSTRRRAFLGAACDLLSWAFTLTPIGQGLDDWLQDACFAYRGTRASATNIVIVNLDSMQSLPRKRMVVYSPELAEVVMYLHGGGARVIGLDVLVSDAFDRNDREPGLGGSKVGLAMARAGNVVLPARRGDDGHLIRPPTS
jgi:CHASE2 domain-containing sensor protein